MNKTNRIDPMGNLVASNVAVGASPFITSPTFEDQFYHYTGGAGVTVEISTDGVAWKAVTGNFFLAPLGSQVRITHSGAPTLTTFSHLFH